jgi:hypothetical protein
MSLGTEVMKGGRKENHQGMGENSLIFLTDYLFLFTIVVQCVLLTEYLHLFLM